MTGSAFQCLPIVTCLFLAGGVPWAMTEPVVLQNAHIRAEFVSHGDMLRLARLERNDGTDRFDMVSDEFEILLFDGTRLTADDYIMEGLPQTTTLDGRRAVAVRARLRDVNAAAPHTVTITHFLGDGPCLHKAVHLGMPSGGKVDRLQVLRFSTDQEASRGGEGQPVFIGNWFAGIDYPGFYSRHSDGFREPDFRYKHHYTIDFEGHDAELAPRPGLVTLFHFPGRARENDGGSWSLVSKRAVLALSPRPGEDAEAALFSYIDKTRLPVRSYLHFNNWYSAKAKSLDIPVYVDEVADTLINQLGRYGAHLDGMVPDHGWENTKTYNRIFEPKPELDLKALQTALAKKGTGLGLWFTVDGTNAGYARGVEIGYKPAYADGFDRTQFRWMSGNKVYFDILDPRYQRDLRKSLRHMIVDGKIDYLKHDFNHNFTSDHLSQRHAREACLDATLELLAYERELNPDIFQNYTNGSWFSPWWFQHAHTIWMMSGDSGGNGSWPQLSLRDGATAYRDSWLFQSFNNPERCPRPLVHIADLMTHGILFTKKKPFTDSGDTLSDWSNYVVMYYARGTTLKELYLDPELLDDDHWMVLGRASAWAQGYQDRLKNTLLVGGDCGVGDVYGYISWTGDKGMLTVRNPDRREQALTVPFDHTVHFRDAHGRPYHARAIYPFVEEMSWPLTSGREFSIDVPGDTTIIFELLPGPPKAASHACPEQLPEAQVEAGNGRFTVHWAVPDEDMTRCELLVQAWGTAVADVMVDGISATSRLQDGGGWTLAACDLRKWRGQTVRIEGRMRPAAEPRFPADGKVPLELWLLADRPVAAPEPALRGTPLPFPISQNHRRVTRRILSKTPIAVPVAAEAH